MPPADHRARPVGLVLVRSPMAPVLEWAKAGVLPVVLAEHGPWTLVVADGPAAVAAPYDDPALLLLARPLPPGTGRGLGFAVVGQRAVIALPPSTRGRVVRWAVWEPDVGVVQAPGLPLARPTEIVAAAGAGSAREVIDLLGERDYRPARLLATAVAVLGLPGSALLEDPARAAALPAAVTVTPRPRQVHYFEDSVKDHVLLRSELGGRQ